MDRGEKIELLVDKTENLRTTSFMYESRSRQLQRTLYWRKIRNYVALGVAALYLIYIASASMCGGLTFGRCRKHG